jgi:hypothetical protein
MNLRSDVRFINLARVLSGPSGSIFLGDLGAHSIRFESPSCGDPVRKMGLYLNGRFHYLLSFNWKRSSWAAVTRPCSAPLLGKHAEATREDPRYGDTELRHLLATGIASDLEEEL